MLRRRHLDGGQPGSRLRMGHIRAFGGAFQGFEQAISPILVWHSRRVNAPAVPVSYTHLALGVVDDSHIVFQENGLIRAVAHAQAASNAADLAGLVDHSTCLLYTSVEYTLRRSDTMLCFSARRSSEAAPVSYYTAALEEVDVYKRQALEMGLSI